MHYRQLTVWQKAMQAALEVYRLAPRLPREETYGMRSQLTRAMASVPANIAEGWTRESRKEKANFLSISQGSLAEVDTFLTLCEQMNWFQVDQIVELRILLVEVGKMLTAIRQKLRDERKR